MHDSVGAMPFGKCARDATFRKRHDPYVKACGDITADKVSDWRRGAKEAEELQLLSLFADDPDAPFSIHRFVQHGATACGKHPGEWFGPSATARCIQ